MLLLQYLLPHHILSRVSAKIAASRNRVVKNFIIKQYSKFYQIDMSDVLEPNILNYATFNEFFTRALRPGTRPLSGGETTIISPVDGRVWQIGRVSADRLINAKGRDFTLEQLLANSAEATQFYNSEFAVLYLAPRDYHRIHMPIKGKLRWMRYIPGRLYSVNPKVIAHIPQVLAKNERVVVAFDSLLGPMLMVLVGAMVVGSIETAWAGRVVPNKRRKIMEHHYTTEELWFARGAEIGRFQLGSTVILFFPSGKIQWDKKLGTGMQLKMGQLLGVGS